MLSIQTTRLYLFNTAQLPPSGMEGPPDETWARRKVRNIVVVSVGGSLKLSRAVLLSTRSLTGIVIFRQMSSNKRE